MPELELFGGGFASFPVFTVAVAVAVPVAVAVAVAVAEP